MYDTLGQPLSSGAGPPVRIDGSVLSSLDDLDDAEVLDLADQLAWFALHGLPAEFLQEGLLC